MSVYFQDLAMGLINNMQRHLDIAGASNRISDNTEPLVVISSEGLILVSQVGIKIDTWIVKNLRVTSPLSD